MTSAFQNNVRKISRPNPPDREPKMCISERKLGSENGFQICIADDVSIPKMTSEKFLAQPPRPRAKNVYLGNGRSDRNTVFKFG